MDVPIADVMVHIDETLSTAELAQIVNQVRATECVVSACTPAGKEHIILVAYNPECIAAADILNKISQNGVHAELAGL